MSEAKAKGKGKPRDLSMQRLNAAKSTGPNDTTLTRLNATKHGLFGSPGRMLDSHEAREMAELTRTLADHWKADCDDPETLLRLNSASFHLLRLMRAYPKLLAAADRGFGILMISRPEPSPESQLAQINILIRHENAAMRAMEWIRTNKEKSA